MFFVTKKNGLPRRSKEIDKDLGRSLQTILSFLHGLLDRVNTTNGSASTGNVTDKLIAWLNANKPTNRICHPDFRKNCFYASALPLFTILVVSQVRYMYMVYIYEDCFE